MSERVKETGNSVFVGNWNYHLPKYEPDKDGDIVLILRLCFGPVEWWAWGIDPQGKFFEEYKWCENEFYESDNYREEITKEQMLERIKYMQQLFTENQVPRYVEAYLEAEKYVLENY